MFYTLFKYHTNLFVTLVNVFNNKQWKNLKKKPILHFLFKPNQ